jgi:DNA-binding beta-propeller fold protein YncE
LVKILDAASGAVVATIPGFGTPDRIAMSPDGRRAAIPDWLCNAVHVADVPGRRVIGAVTGLGRPHDVEIAPDNRVAFVTLGREKAVAVVDLETRRVLARHAVQDAPDGVGWGPAPRH